MGNKKKLKDQEQLEGLTVDQLRTYKGFEKVTDDEALNIIHSLRTFASITFRVFRNFKTKKK